MWPNHSGPSPKVNQTASVGHMVTVVGSAPEPYTSCFMSSGNLEVLPMLTGAIYGTSIYMVWPSNDFFVK